MIKILAALLLPSALSAQSSSPVQTPLSLATRMSQLMESTAVAVPDLIHASEPLRHLAGNTLESMKGAPGNSVFPYRFINEVKAYLALSDSYPAPQLPEIANRQFAELRDDLQKIQQLFETDLAAQAESAVRKASDPDNLSRYSEANTKLPPLGTVPRIVFMGDSITDAWPLSEYFLGRDFVNRGISGQTTEQMLGRFLQDVISTRAKAVVILGGTNDIAHGISPGSTEDALTMMGELARAHGIKPVFASILPVRDASGDRARLAAIQQINRWLQDYCHREGFLYLDYFTALADAGGRMPADLSDDGLHPNAKGYGVMAPVALEAVNRALAVNSAAPAPPAPRKRFALPVIK